MRQRIYLVLLAIILVVRPILSSVEPRIISLSPASTEILFSLGLQKYIVGVSYLDNFPPEVKKISRVGDAYSINLEKIFQVRAQIIFSPPTNVLRQQENFLKKQGIEIVIIDPKNLGDILHSLSLISKTVSLRQKPSARKETEARRQELLRSISARIKKIEQQRQRIKKHPKIFVLLSDQPYFTCGKNSFLNEAVELAGGENIFSDVDQAYFSVSPEEIIKRKPEIILVLVPNYPRKSSRLTGQKLVIDNINPDIFVRPTLRIFSGIESLQKIIIDYEKE